MRSAGLLGSISSRLVSPVCYLPPNKTAGNRAYGALGMQYYGLESIACFLWQKTPTQQARVFPFRHFFDLDAMSLIDLVISVIFSVSPTIRRVPSASPLVPSNLLNQGCLKGTRPRATSVPGLEPMSPWQTSQRYAAKQVGACLVFVNDHVLVTLTTILFVRGNCSINPLDGWESRWMLSWSFPTSCEKSSKFIQACHRLFSGQRCNGRLMLIWNKFGFQKRLDKRMRVATLRGKHGK